MSNLPAQRRSRNIWIKFDFCYHDSATIGALSSSRIGSCVLRIWIIIGHTPIYNELLFRYGLRVILIDWIFITGWNSLPPTRSDKIGAPEHRYRFLSITIIRIPNTPYKLNYNFVVNLLLSTVFSSTASEGHGTSEASPHCCKIQ